MKRLLLLLLLLLIATNSFAEEPAPVNGYLHEIEGQRILHVWGTPHEMGYAHGYLLGQEVIDLFHGYILELVPLSIYKLAYQLVAPLFELPQDFQDEGNGLLAGMRDAGVDMNIGPLGREIELADLLFCNAVADIGAAACSTEIAWGSATQDDPLLEGETAMARNLDWPTAGPNPYLLPESAVLIAFSPSAENQSTVVSYTYPGFFACLSCMNDQGVSAAVNVAHNGVPILDIDFGDNFVPIGVSIRQALHEDVDQSGKLDLYDVVESIENNPRSGAVIVNLAQPLAGSDGDPGAVLESDNGGVILRVPADQPELGDSILIATNHLRKLRAKDACDRYDLLLDEIGGLGNELTTGSMLDLLGMVKQNWFLSRTLQTVTFFPSTLRMGMSFTTADAVSIDRELVELSWEQMTALPEEPDDDDDDNDDDTASDDDDTVPEDSGDSEDDSEGCCG
jgi:hypothetical protein